MAKVSTSGEKSSPSVVMATSGDLPKDKVLSEIYTPFPDDFKWGSSTSSYQVEGAIYEDGRGESIWDVFSHTGHILGGANADVACDMYHRYESDIKDIMKEALGLQVYRFSVDWPRILPTGRGEINQPGLDYYNRVIDLLLENGIEPYITLYHWDLPQALQDEYGGWVSRKVIDDYANFVRICFEAFGDRVKMWWTFNEPWTVSTVAYGFGSHAPGLNYHIDTDPYIVTHIQLLAHARAVKIYREEFQGTQGGLIGITNVADWRIPLTQSEADYAAAERNLEFQLAWFTDPIFGNGDYPAVMREHVGDRLPHFTPEEKAEIQGSADFFGFNYYTAWYMSEPTYKIYLPGYWGRDMNVVTSPGDFPLTEYGWPIVPWGLREVLKWIAKRYPQNPPIYITENGAAFAEDHDGALHDYNRVDFYRQHIKAVGEAIEEGVNVRAYCAWSLFDNFEWDQGYTKRFGIVRVDFDTLVRTVKMSGKFFADVIKSNGRNLFYVGTP